MDSGPPGWFVALGIFVVVAGVVTFFVRIAIARNLARKTGIDESAAVRAEIFGTGAITSMYLQAHRQDGAVADDAGHVVADLSPYLRKDIGED